jgi:pimeloyl-ACP methyl ester carboxylesterase
MTALPNIVLVHGAWANGSSWNAVIEQLQADGYRVTVPAFSLTRLADDVDRLRQILGRQNGPTLVAGHSYGGQIITALGTDTPNVVGLVSSPRSGWMRVNRSAPCWNRRRQVPPWRISTSTRTASPGSPRTTSSTTSRPTSIRSWPRSCSRSSSRCIGARSAR